MNSFIFYFLFSTSIRISSHRARTSASILILYSKPQQPRNMHVARWRRTIIHTEFFPARKISHARIEMIWSRQYVHVFESVNKPRTRRRWTWYKYIYIYFHEHMAQITQFSDTRTCTRTGEMNVHERHGKKVNKLYCRLSVLLSVFVLYAYSRSTWRNVQCVW